MQLGVVLLTLLSATASDCAGVGVGVDADAGVGGGVRFPSPGGYGFGPLQLFFVCLLAAAMQAFLVFPGG